MARFQDNFDDVGSEFEPWVPTDHKNASDLPLIQKISDPEYRALCTHLHNLWLDLGKKINVDVKVSLKN